MKKSPIKPETITYKSGRQVTTADPEKVKAAMRPAIAKDKKPRTLPGMSENTQRVKDGVFRFAASGFPRILPYFTPRNPHYNVAAKYLGPEDILHIAICAYIAEYHPALKVTHTPNEGKAGHVGQAKKKLMGVQSGVSDLIIEKPGTMQKLYLEVKVAPNKPTVEQLAYLEFQSKCGHMAGWVDNIVSAVARINVFNANK